MMRFFNNLYLTILLLAVSSSNLLGQNPTFTWMGGSEVVNQSSVYGTMGFENVANIPGARENSISWVDNSGDIWLFGGSGYDKNGSIGSLNDFWKYNVLTGIWTWMGGSNVKDQIGIYGTKGVSSALNFPGSRYESISWTDADGNLWLFGGVGYGKNSSLGGLNDLWKYTKSAGTWTWMGGSDVVEQSGVYGSKGVPSALNVPGSRSGSISWTDGSGNLWLFGGNGYLNDLWRYSIKDNVWTWMSGSDAISQSGAYGTMKVASTNNVPGARRSSVSWTDTSGDLWLFGGIGYAKNSTSGILNDLWKYNPTSGTWTWMSGGDVTDQSGSYGSFGIEASSNIPGARYSSITWVDKTGNLWLFGGYGYPNFFAAGALNDLWKYTVSSGFWTWMGGSNTIGKSGVYGVQKETSTSYFPGGRNKSTARVDLFGNFWLFGGNGLDKNGSYGYLNDLWKIQIPSPPTISSFTPSNGTSGTTITITGTNFTGATKVSFGGIDAASFTVASSTSITAVVGSGASGSVSVTTPGGTATRDGFAFYIVEVFPPLISSFIPTSAVSGTTVTITGTFLNGANKVSFGGIDAASFTVVSSTSITAVVGSGATGSVSVTTPGGTALSSETFTYIPNTAPTDISLSTSSITENQPIGTSVGTLSSTDGEGGIMTYTLVAGTGGTDNGSFTISGTLLKSAIAFDYETKSSYSIRIRVTDSGGLSFEKQFTITIINDPTDPTFEPTAQPTNLAFSNVTSSSITVGYTAAVGSPTGYLVIRKAGSLPTSAPVDGTAYASGTVLGDGTVAYGGSNVTFSDTGLSAATTYFYKIYTYNGSGTSTNYLQSSPLSGSQATTVTNTAPTDIILSASSIAENQPIGTTVGTLSAADAEGGTMTYTLVSGTGDTDNSSFTISGSTLKSANIFDYEGTKTSYSIRIRVTDSGGLSFEKQFTITIIDDPTDPTFEPTAQPTNLAFGNVTSASITVGYTAAVGSPTGYLVIRKAGSLPTSAPVDGTAYASGTVLGDGTVAYGGINVTFSDTGLSAATTYYYKIYSYNGSGTSTNYLQVSPLSGSQATAVGNAAPTDISLSTTSIAENQSIGTTVGTLTATDAEGGAMSYSLVVGTGDTDNASFTIAGSTLKSAIIFDYETKSSFSIRIRVTDNGSLMFEKQFTISVTNDPSDNDTTAPVISNSTTETTAAGTPITVSVTVTDAESAVNAVSISYGPSDATTFTLTNEAMTKSGTTWSYTIPGPALTDPGVRYRITAVNTAGLSAIENYVIGISYAGSGLAIPYSQFGTGLSSYKIIAIPLKLSNNSVNGVFGNALGLYGDVNKWRMFHYSSGTTKELTGSSLLERGKGYWLIAAETTTLNTGSGSTGGSLDKPTSISLTNGWNQIGNPYTYRLTWADILAANAGLSVQNTLRIFKNGNFENGNALDAFEGGFIFVNRGETLVYPGENKGGRQSSADSKKREEQNESNWEINFQLSNEAMNLTSVGLGMREDGAEGFDAYDDFTLPRMADYLELNHRKKLHDISYAKDIIPTAAEHTWEFEVTSNSSHSLHSMTWRPEELHLASGKYVLLWDLMRSRAIDMLAQRHYTFPIPARFRVIYGSEEYVKHETSSSRFIVHEPFPNPALRTVTFSFVVPDDQAGDRITLELFDQSGKSIERIVDWSFAAGYQEVTWDFTSRQSIAQGVYVIKIMTSNEVYTQKIILIP